MDDNQIHQVELVCIHDNDIMVDVGWEIMVELEVDELDDLEEIQIEFVEVLEVSVDYHV